MQAGSHRPTMADKEEPQPADLPNDFDVIFIEKNFAYIEKQSIESQEEREAQLTKHLPDHWVVVHSDALWVIHNDIMQQAIYSTLLDEMTFGDFCEYMQYTNNNQTHNEHDWRDPNVRYCVLKYPGKVYPTFKQFVAHMLEDILSLLRYLHDSYNYDFGCVETFFDICYDHSSSSSKLPY